MAKPVVVQHDASKVIPVFRDIVNYFGPMAGIDVVRVECRGDETSINATEPDKELIVRAKVKNNIPELEGEFGMVNITTTLKGIVNDAGFKNATSTFSIRRDTKQIGDEEVQAPVQMTFTDNEEQQTVYRFMSPDMIPSQGKFKGISEWDVEFRPSGAKISEFCNRSSYVSLTEKLVRVSASDGKVIFKFGDFGDASHGGFVNMTTDSSSLLKSGEISSNVLWIRDRVDSIFKLTQGNDVKSYKMRLSDKGIFMISIETENLEIDYIMPSKKR